jgi:hypothetical protein
MPKRAPMLYFNLRIKSGVNYTLMYSIRQKNCIRPGLTFILLLTPSARFVHQVQVETKKVLILAHIIPCDFWPNLTFDLFFTKPAIKAWVVFYTEVL